MALRPDQTEVNKIVFCITLDEYVSQSKIIPAYVTMEEDEQKNLRISGYFLLEAGWQLSIRFSNGFGWMTKIKAGSTLSVIHVSEVSAPVVFLRSNDYQLFMRSPSHSENVHGWSKICRGTAFQMTEGKNCTIYVANNDCQYQ